MDSIKPQTAAELAATLAAAAEADRTITIGGAFSKQCMGGPACPSAVNISTASLRRVLQYEPQDLTISVEAGLPWHELQEVLSRHGQMIPLDPPFFDTATVGGVIAANSSGPRRRLYGTARDIVIGMKFATLEGKLVQSGGMVVKNVAGLDMAKLMIGSFGTLAAIAAVNFKLVPMPALTRTFTLAFEDLDRAIAGRDRILRGVLQPAAIDLLNPPASARAGRSGWLLLVHAGGNRAAMDRYSREIAGAEELEGAAEDGLWRVVREFVPNWMGEDERRAVVRCSTTLAALAGVLRSLEVPAIARAGSGVCYACFRDIAFAAGWLAEAAERGWKAVIEFAASSDKPGVELWPVAGGDLAVMEKIKSLFDPKRLLNRGRLYGRI